MSPITPANTLHTYCIGEGLNFIAKFIGACLSPNSKHCNMNKPSACVEG